MVRENIEFIRQFDPEVAEAISLEYGRQRRIPAHAEMH